MFEALAPGIDIWHDTQRLSLPGGIIFHARCTVVKLEDGGLWVHSPIRFDEGMAAQLEELGPVRHIVAPNGFHHLFAEAAKQRWPEAKLWASPALKGRVEPDHWLGGKEEPWGELAVHRIEGAPKMDEFTFLHRTTQSLIVTDLAFHIRYETNFQTRLVLRMAGAHGGRLAQSRLWRTVVKDRAACRSSVEKLLKQDFERLVVAHGDCIHQGARPRLRAALWWILGEKPAVEAA